MGLNIALEAVMQTVVAGLLAGIIYGLMATGVGLIFGVMRVVNFAQGEFLMLGMYGAVFAAALLAPLGLFGVTLGAYVGVLLTGPVIFVLGAIIHRLVLSRSTGLRAAGAESEGHYTQMILTLGISLIFQNVALAWFGAVPRQNQTPISDQAWTMRPFPWVDAEVFVNQGQAISCLVAAAMVVAIYQVFSRTSVGKALRLSLRATGNGAFQALADGIVKQIGKGKEIAKVIGRNAIFPVEFVAALSVGEVSGQIPEVMERQADFYREETARRMKTLTRLMAWGVYAMVGVFIIIAIFRMASVYVQAVGGG